jgi:hypothetical protein
VSALENLISNIMNSTTEEVERAKKLGEERHAEVTAHLRRLEQKIDQLLPAEKSL